MTPEDLRSISELLTELRWLTATYTSFIPQTSKEYKLFKTKLARINVLRELCEEEAMKGSPT